MLITRKSPRRTGPFASRFRETAGDFPLRQYLRCQEELYSGVVKACLLAAFAVTLAILSRSIWNLFEVHGTHLSPWYQRIAMLVMVLMILLVVFRCAAKVRSLFEVRDEMRYLKRQMSSPDPSR